MLALSTDKTESLEGFLSNLLGLKIGDKGAEGDTFSLLLKSFTLGKSDGKELLLAKNQHLGLSTEAKPKSATAELPIDIPLQAVKTEEASPKAKLTKLLSLFSPGDEKAADEEQFHPDIIKAIPPKDIKQSVQTLIGEAKSFLKEQILQHSDVKELPKTLGGLIKLAEQSGIDVKAINFESLSKTALPKEVSQAILEVKAPLPQVLSTSQIVKPTSIKQHNQEQATPKPLNALLTTKSGDISTPSIPVVQALEEVPVEEIQATKTSLSASITSLLHGEVSKEEGGEGESSVKLEGVKESDKPQLVTQTKNDTLTQKITEAKQLVTHVAQSLRESVENYKPPFTRIKMQLNPQKFGEMDVTLVQRGSNVHININANSTALTVMMQNAHELKAQLSAQGLGDASMNFSSQQQHEGQKHKQEQAGLTYEEFQDFEEEFSEVATALEVVVPRYI